MCTAWVGEGVSRGNARLNPRLISWPARIGRARSSFLSHALLYFPTRSSLSREGSIQRHGGLGASRARLFLLTPGTIHAVSMSSRSHLVCLQQCVGVSQARLARELKNAFRYRHLPAAQTEHGKRGTHRQVLYVGTLNTRRVIYSHRQALKEEVKEQVCCACVVSRFCQGLSS